MTRFEQYITEGGMSDNYNVIEMDDEDELKSLIKNDCSKYLTLLGSKPPLIRCRQFVVDRGTIVKGKVRQDRRPTGMNIEAFKGFNKWAVKNGIPSREKSVSVIRENVLGGMWQENYFFPIGDFKYGWVESEDFNFDSNGWVGMGDAPFVWAEWKYQEEMDLLGKIKDKYGRKTVSKSDTPEIAKRVIDDIKAMVHGNENFKIPYTYNYEIWIECKEYYLVPKQIWENTK